MRHLGTHLPGAGAGDNLDFLWNLFWMRRALASPSVDFFFTRALFHPTGVDLTLNTHTALQSWLGATVLGGLPIVTAQNVLILLNLWLGAACAYALAFDVTRSRAAAAVAALIYGGSPYVVTRLLGHFNLLAVFGIPLFLLLFRRAMHDGRARFAVGAGAALALTAYDDYYYVVFSIAAAAVLLARHLLEARVARRPTTGFARRARLGLAALGAVALAALVAIEVTGGTVLEGGGVRVVLQGTFNLRAALWALAWLLAASYWTLSVRLAPDARRRLRAVLPQLGLAVATFTAAVWPILWRAISLWQRGDYVSQAYAWRSAPKGVDAAMLVLGNRLHPLWGSFVDRAYGALGLERIDAVWLGVLPIVLLAVAWRRRRALPEAGEWWLLGGVFFVWALGPYLYVAGHNTGFFLPEILLRFVPVLANARIPGRAFVVVYLAAGIIAALLLSRSGRVRAHPALLALAGALVLVDYLGAPIALYALPSSPVYQQLAREPGEGAVLEIPLGLRDGFGEHGSFDPEVMYFQTVHGRPIVGGFAARVPRRVFETDERLPVISTLLRLSAGEPVSPSQIGADRLDAPETLRTLDIAYVVVRRDRCSDALLRYVAAVLPLRPIAEDESRTLYAVAAADAVTGKPSFP